MVSIRSGSVGFWHDKPHLEEEFAKLVQGMRIVGQIVNSRIIHILLLGFLQQRMPTVLLQNGGSFEASTSFCKQWARKKLGWTFRAQTTNQSKLPANYEEQIEAMVLCIAYLVCAYRIPVELVINGDQTGEQLLLVGRERTYALKGCQEVVIAGAGDKQHITLLVSLSATRDLLPFHVIYSGKTRNSLPSPPRLMFLKEQGWNLNCIETHWSTITSMKEYIQQVIMPFYRSTCAQRNLEMGQQRMILLLDCYSVHTSVEFRSWMKKNYNFICLLYIPGGCTSIAQPADVVLQRPLKAAIHREFQICAAREVARELDNEHSDVSSFKLNTSMQNLRDKSCDFLWAAHQHVREMREMIVKGWEKCKILEAWKVEKQMASFEANRNSQLFVEEETFILD
ncbi:hypothetical protein R1flu_022571 [Riccia fluitans]|uniref:DDE-1 domain-containing protein n=1 Tax=Riccia fluitans TaxID=41844 RepID=A0ABD1XPM2_9MARC